MAATEKTYIYECGVLLPGTTNELMLTVRSTCDPAKECKSPRFFLAKKRGRVTLNENRPDGGMNIENEATFTKHGNKLMRCNIPDALVTEPSMYVPLSEGLSELRNLLPEDEEIPLEIRGYSPAGS